MDIEEALDDGGGVVRISGHRSERMHWARAAENGLVVRALPGVVMDAALVADPMRWVHAVALWNPDAVIAGAAAAALRFGTDSPPRVIPVYVRGELADRGPIRFRRGRLAQELITWHHGIRVTNPVGTVLTAGVEGDLETGTDLLRQRHVSPEDIVEQASYWSRRDATRADVVVRALRGNPWSVAEVEAHELLRRAGIRGWRGNAEVRLQGHVYAPDISIPSARIAFEVNSYEFHSSPAAMERDAARLNAFLAAGWRSYVLTPRQIRDYPAETIQFIRSVVWRRHRRQAVTIDGLAS